MKIIKAFTLAEVLITLAILGVVAAITIPTVIVNSQKEQFVSKLKKEYSTLSNAYILLVQEYGGSITDVPGFSSTTDDSTEDISALSALATKLSIQKNCGSAKGCWYNSPQKLLGGGTYSSNLESSWNGHYGKAVLSDGTLIRVDIYDAQCSFGSGTGPYDKAICGSVILDVNGIASPNQRGRDVFAFNITKTGIFPYGLYNDGATCSTIDTSYSSSNGCTAKVLTEGAMNY